MMQALIDPRNPYDGGYALPQNVRAEPAGRGTFTTEQLARGSISRLPKAWTGGYALPPNVIATQDRQGAATTQQLRRRTISRWVPSSFGDAGTGENPIARYGRLAADRILGTLPAVHPAFRQAALDALLDELDPGLRQRVAAGFARRAISPDDVDALRAVLAEALAEGFRKELADLGRRAPRIPGLLGLGYYGPLAHAVAFDGFWGKIGSAIKTAAVKTGSAIKTATVKTGSAIKTAAVKTGSGVKTAATATGSAIKTAASGVKTAAMATGSAIASGAQTAAKWGKDAIEGLADLACDALQDPAITTAIGTAAAPATGGASLAASQAGNAICAGGKAPAAPPASPPAPSLPAWVPYALAGGGALLGIALLARRSA